MSNTSQAKPERLIDARGPRYTAAITTVVLSAALITESNLDLVRRVDIRSTPTTIFLDSKGFEIARAKGAPKRDQLIKAIKAI